MENFKKFLKNSKKRIDLLSQRIALLSNMNIQPLVYEFSSSIAVESEFSMESFSFLNITGTAIKPGVWSDMHNKLVKLNKNELKKAVVTLKNKPIYYEHRRKGVIEEIGEVIDAWYDEKTDEIKYRALITDKEYAEKIYNGDLKHVSAKLYSFRSNMGDENIPTGRNIWFTELSIVKHPAVNGANIEVFKNG